MAYADAALVALAQALAQALAPALDTRGYACRSMGVCCDALSSMLALRSKAFSSSMGFLPPARARARAPDQRDHIY